MASTDARPVPIKNTAFRVYFTILDADGDPTTGAAALDSEVSKDGAAFADCTNETTEISQGVYYLDLTSTEMNADAVCVIVKTSTSGAKAPVMIFYPQEAGDIKVDLETVKAQAVTCAAGVTVLASVGTAATSTAQTGDAYARLGAPVGASISADVAAVQADTDNIQTRIPAALVSGRIDASVGAMAADVVTASAIAADAIGSSELAASAVTEIQTGLSTLDAAGVRTAVGLASANLDTQLSTIDDFLDTEIAAILAAVDTEVAAIKAKTDNLPSDPADASDIAAAFATVNATLATIAAYIDTEVAAIKAKTDNLPTDPADASDIAASFTSIASTLTTIAAYIDTEVAAIKTVTDQFTAAQTEPTSVPAANATPLQKIAWLAALARNKVTQTSTTQTLKADDGSTTIATATVSDDATTFTRGEWA